MRIGVPKEIRANENRVGLVPGCVRERSACGHQVLVENLDDTPAETRLAAAA